jgi:glycosyltransferase involved in cell wall biosynthesis
MAVSRKLKICFLVLSHHSHTMGGAEYRCKLLIDELIKRDEYDIHYLCRNADPDYTPNGYVLHTYGTWSGKYGNIFDGLNLYQALKKIAPEFIYQNGLSGVTGLASICAKRLKARLICQICSDHSILPLPKKGIKSLLKNGPELILRNYGIRNAEKITGQTESQNQLLYRHHGRYCDAIIPLGHPLPSEPIQKRDKINVLWIGNLRAIKRPDLFIRLANAFSHRADIVFTMIGGAIGPADKHTAIMELIRRTPNINYLGQLSPEEVNQHLCEGHILVNTSDNEGFSNTFVQAWLRGVPVVSLNVDPDGVLIREKIGMHSQTVDRMIEDVAYLVDNQDACQNMGRSAISYAIENHTSISMANGLLDLFGAKSLS